MFDPNSCHDFERTTKDPANSCLNWFKNIEDLLKLYVTNLPKDHRSSIFKIAKVESIEFVEKAADWQRFKAIGANKWILTGSFSESSENFNEAYRNHQSICMSTVALGLTRELGMQSWTREIVNEILNIGDEFYSGSVIALKNQQKFVSPDLTVMEVGTELKLMNTLVDFVFDEGVIKGNLTKIDEENLSLDEGLKKFFEDDDLALVTSCGVTVAVWRHGEAFYLFDSHDRDHLGRNLKAIDPLKGCMIPGAACVLRFITIEDLAKHIFMNLEITDNPDYSISLVEVLPRSSSAPCLYHFKKFGEEPYAGILRAFNDAHEDSEQFKTSLKQKTWCNLMACMGFTRILNPRQWTSSDINEILKIGYKMLCKLAPTIKQGETEITWSFFENFEVGSVQMTTEVLTEQTGTFKGFENSVSGIDGKNEEMKERFSIAKIESRRSVAFPDVNISNTSTIGERVEDSESLKAILGVFDKYQESFGIFRSKLFDIVIFKLNRFYFVFDPKASDDKGGMTSKRLEEFIKVSMKRERELMLQKIKNSGSKRPSIQEEFEELIFGRPVTFAVPFWKSSFAKIAPVVSKDMAPIEIHEKGSAYVAWFSSIQLLHSHIMDKVPEKFKSEKFTFESFKVEKTLESEVKVQPWNNFEGISPNHWILRASISQNDTQFSKINRNNQNIPNCIISLTFSQFCVPTDWNPTVLDIILKFGDRLYKKSLKKSVKSTENTNLRLRLDQLDLPVFIRPFVISVSDEIVKRDSIVKAQDAEPIEAMKKNLAEFLTAPDATGILSSKDYHVAIWGANGGFMMFDPHDIGPDGERKSTGFACLQRFENPKKLVEVFCKNVMDLEGPNEYQLTRVSIVRNYFKETSHVDNHRRLDVADSDNLSNFSDYNVFTSVDGIRSIRGKEAKTIHWTDENVPLGVCYAVATLCVSRSLDPEYYTRDIIDKIILFGNDLMSACRDICFSDFDICNNASCEDEVNWNFELNNNKTNIQMDVFQRGVIATHPCPAPKLIHALEDFFNFYSIGILVTQSFIVAIWKELGDFFIFYSCPINEIGEIQTGRIEKSDQAPAFPGLVVFSSIDELYENIIGNIDKESYCKPFELRSCTITMTDLCDEPLETSCSSEMRKFVVEEFVLPAVSAGVGGEVINEDRNVAKFSFDDTMLNSCDKPGFKSIGKGGIVCGKLSTCSKKFKKYARENQSAAICLTSVAVSSLKDLNCWSTDVIDCVITSGNRLFIESSIANDTKDVTMSMLITSVNFAGCEINLRIEKFRDFTRENLEIDFLIATLCELFSCNLNGYLCCGRECWALFKRGKAFYVFDPLGIEVKEKKITRRRAVLYKFETVEAMAERLMRMFVENCENDFEIGAIFICPTPPKKFNLENLTRNCSPDVAQVTDSSSDTSQCSSIDDSNAN